MTTESKEAASEKDICGDLAFEHGCEDGVRQMWRVLYWHGWKGRRLRASNFYADEVEAFQHVSRILDAPDMELISVSHYRLESVERAAS